MPNFLVVAVIILENVWFRLKYSFFFWKKHANLITWSIEPLWSEKVVPLCPTVKFGNWRQKKTIYFGNNTNINLCRLFILVFHCQCPRENVIKSSFFSYTVAGMMLNCVGIIPSRIGNKIICLATRDTLYHIIYSHFESWFN